MKKMASYEEGMIIDEVFAKAIGLLHEFLITGKKVGFGRTELISLAQSPELLENVRDFIRTRNSIRDWGPQIIKIARKILGEKNVFSDYDTINAWGEGDRYKEKDWGKPLAKNHIPEIKNIFKQCAVDNKNGKNHWILIYTMGISIIDSIKRSEYHSHSFLGSSIGVLPNKELLNSGNEELKTSFSSQYYLIDIIAKNKEDIIANNDQYIIPHTSTVLEILLTLSRWEKIYHYAVDDYYSQGHGLDIYIDKPENTMNDCIIKLLPETKKSTKKIIFAKKIYF